MKAIPRIQDDMLKEMERRSLNIAPVNIPSFETEGDGDLKALASI